MAIVYPDRTAPVRRVPPPPGRHEAAGRQPEREPDPVPDPVLREQARQGDRDHAPEHRADHPGDRLAEDVAPGRRTEHQHRPECPPGRVQLEPERHEQGQHGEHRRPERERRTAAPEPRGPGLGRDRPNREPQGHPVRREWCGVGLARQGRQMALVEVYGGSAVKEPGVGRCVDHGRDRRLRTVREGGRDSRPVPRRRGHDRHVRRGSNVRYAIGKGDVQHGCILRQGPAGITRRRRAGRKPGRSSRLPCGPTPSRGRTGRPPASRVGR